MKNFITLAFIGMIYSASFAQASNTEGVFEYKFSSRNNQYLGEGVVKLAAATTKDKLNTLIQKGFSDSLYYTIYSPNVFGRPFIDTVMNNLATGKPGEEYIFSVGLAKTSLNAADLYVDIVYMYGTNTGNSLEQRILRNNEEGIYLVKIQTTLTKNKFDPTLGRAAVRIEECETIINHLYFPDVQVRVAFLIYSVQRP